MSPAESRVLSALASRPMTVNELADTVYVDSSWLRHCLRRLRDQGRVRQGGKSSRVNIKGATPRNWELA